MKRISFSILFLLAICTNISCQNDLKSFRNSTIANEPNLKQNTAVVISENVKAKNGDFIAYNHNDSFAGLHKRIHRLVAQEKDVVEIRNGILYVNNINNDIERNLIHFYFLPKKDYLDIKRKEKISDEFTAVLVGSDSAQAMLEDEIAKKYGWENQRKISPVGKTDKTIQQLFNQNWNDDNFGPLEIPKNKVFVLGDNRHSSEDSRYIGLIDKSQILGVVVLKE